MGFKWVNCQSQTKPIPTKKEEFPGNLMGHRTNGQALGSKFQPVSLFFKSGNKV